MMTEEERREILRARAGQGDLTRYGFTRGFSQYDALQFWNDARAIGLVTIGVSERGTKLYGFPREARG